MRFSTDALQPFSHIPFPPAAAVCMPCLFLLEWGFCVPVSVGDRWPARSATSARQHAFPSGALPFPDVAVPEDLVHVQRKFLSGLGYAILLFWKQTKGLTDAEALIALEHMAPTFAQLRSGIYYEKLPDAALPRELYRQLAAFIEEYQKNEAERTGSAPLSLTGAPALPEKEIFQVLVEEC